MPTGAVGGAETAPGMPTDLVQGSPAEAVGLSGTESAAAEATSVAAAGAAAQWEEVSERSETGKVYRLSDGSYAAVNCGRAAQSAAMINLIE